MPGKQDQPRQQLAHRMQPDAHGGHHAEISPTAAQRPEQLRIRRGIRGDEAAIGKDELGAEQIVQRQAVSGGQRPIAAAQRQPGHADRTDGAGDGGEVMRCCGGDHIRRRGAALDHSDTGLGIDRDAPHAREIQHQAIGPQRPPHPVMPAAANRQGQVMDPANMQSGLHVLGRFAKGEKRRAMVDSPVPDMPGAVIGILARQCDLARHRAAQLIGGARPRAGPQIHHRHRRLPCPLRREGTNVLVPSSPTGCGALATERFRGG